MGCDSEALRRNRLKLGWLWAIVFRDLGCDSVSAAASSSFKIRVVSDSEALLQAVRCLGMLGCDSEALRRNRSYILTIYFFQVKISKQSQC